MRQPTSHIVRVSGRDCRRRLLIGAVTIIGAALASTSFALAAQYSPPHTLPKSSITNEGQGNKVGSFGFGGTPSNSGAGTAGNVATGNHHHHGKGGGGNGKGNNTTGGEFSNQRNVDTSTPGLMNESLQGRGNTVQVNIHKHKKKH